MNMHVLPKLNNAYRCNKSDLTFVEIRKFVESVLNLRQACTVQMWMHKLATSGRHKPLMHRWCVLFFLLCKAAPSVDTAQNLINEYVTRDPDAKILIYTLMQSDLQKD